MGVKVKSKINNFWIKSKLKITKFFNNFKFNAFLLSKEEYDYNFKIVDYKKVGLVFILSAIVIPFVLSISLNYLFLDKNGASNKNVLEIVMIVNLIIVSVGFFLIFNWVKNKLIKQGLIAFYIFYYIPIIVSLLLGLFFNITKLGWDNSKNLPGTTDDLVANLLADLISVIVTFIMCPLVYKKIWLTLKTKIWYILMFVPLCLVVAFLFNYLFSILNSVANNGNTGSDNQDQLNLYLNNWYDIVLLTFYTVLIAPIIEELACRHGIFGLCGNKWLGFGASIIYFSGMHVINNGDWQHIIGYLGGAIVLASIFLFAEGNVTYSILTHSGLNIITLIILIVSHK